MGCLMRSFQCVARGRRCRGATGQQRCRHDGDEAGNGTPRRPVPTHVNRVHLRTSTRARPSLVSRPTTVWREKSPSGASRRLAHPTVGGGQRGIGDSSRAGNALSGALDLIVDERGERRLPPPELLEIERSGEAVEETFSAAHDDRGNDDRQLVDDPASRASRMSSAPAISNRLFSGSSASCPVDHTNDQNSSR